MSIKDKLNKNLSAQAFLLTASRVVTLLISLVTNMLLSRFRSLEEFGTYSEIIVVITLAVSIFTLGLPNSINYFLPKSKDAGQRDKFLSVYYFSITAISVVMGLVLVIATPIIVKYYDNPSIEMYSYLLLIIPWTKVIIGGRSNMFVATSRATKEITHNVLNSIFLLLIILFTKVLNESFNFYLILYVVVEVVFTIAVYFETYRLMDKINLSFDLKFFKQILAFSIPMGLSSAVGTLCAEVDKLMIGWLYDEASVAIYSNAGRELPITYLSTSFTAVMLPQIVKLLSDEKKEKAVKLWRDSIELCFIIMNFFSVVCVVFAPQIISLLYSDKYLDGVNVFRIYSLVLSLRVTYWGMMLNAYGKSKTILYTSVISLMSNVILNVICYFAFGFSGPAVATFLSVAVAVVFQLLFTKKETGFTIKNILPVKRLFFVLAVNGIFGVALTLLVEKFVPGTDWKSICVCVVIGFVWFMVYALIMSKRLKTLIKGINLSRAKV